MATDPRPAWERLTLDAHGFIQASAGTGKTYTVERLVARILTRPGDNPWKRLIDLDEMLIVTYTEKATEELRLRIRALLEKLLREESASLGAEIAAHVEKCLMRFDRAGIFTIHGFCNRFLSSNAFESRVALGSRQADADGIAGQVVLALVREELRESVWVSAARIQESLASWGMKDIETFMRVCSSVLARLNLEAGDRVLPDLTLEEENHTRERLAAACALMKATFTSVSPDSHPFVTGWSADRFKSALKLSRKPDYRTIAKQTEFVKTLLWGLPERDDPEALLHWVVTSWPERASGPGGVSALLAISEPGKDGYRTVGDISGVLGPANGVTFEEVVRCAQTIADCAFALRYAALTRLLKAGSGLVKAQKARDGLITYDDMIAGMHRNLREPGSPLLALLRRRYRYGIIDEFQDTNAQQWGIFKRIFVDDNHVRSGEEKSFLYVVGDPKQSIFSFQGSDVRVYLAALQQLRDAGGKPVDLDVNYRGSPAMVDACNALFSIGKAGEQSQDWFAGDVSGITYTDVRAGDKTGEVECAAGLPKHLRSPVVFRQLHQVSEGGAETRRKPGKERDLAQWICAHIRYLTGLKQGRTPLRLPAEAGSFRNISLGDICVLVEAHAEAQPVMALLRQQGIPYTKQRNTGLFASEECLHLLAVLDAVDRPGDPAAVRKALLTRFFGIGASQLGGAAQEYGEWWDSAVELLQRLARLREQQRWGRVLGELFAATRVFARLSEDPERAPRSAALRQLRNYCLRALIDGRHTLTELVARLRALNRGELTEVDEESTFHKETETEAVRILTVFSAKGLEFPVVFVAAGKWAGKGEPDFFSFRNPSGGMDFVIDSGGATAAYRDIRRQEIRRLYYVAMTRAKYRLFLPLWDLTVADGIADRRDKTSASALFLSRACTAALGAQPVETPVDQRRFSLDQGELPTAPVLPAAPSAPSVKAGVWAREDGGPLPAPRARMTVQESYSGIVRLAEKLGIRTNPGGDERHGAGMETGRVDRKHAPADALPASARSGDAVHAILEEADFAQWAGVSSATELLRPGSSAAALVDRCLSSRGLLTGDAAGCDDARLAAADMVRKSLLAAFPEPAGGGNLVLASLDKSCRRPEAEFHFTFGKNGAPFPPRGEAIGGWVLGFIDLLFRNRGRYYLLDWKSNKLPSYDTPAIDKSMAEHRYDVQYQVYSLALHRWLAQQVPGYQPEQHFGGVIYVYLRGTCPGSGDGIWTLRPTPEQLETVWPAELARKLAPTWDGREDVRV